MGQAPMPDTTERSATGRAHRLLPADLGRITQFHPVVYICVPIFAAIAIQMVFRRQSEWEDVFLRAAGELLQGLDIYRSGRAFLYPPFSAFAAIPFTVIPPLL